MKKPSGLFSALFMFLTGLIGAWLCLMKFDIDVAFYSILLLVLGTIGLLGYTNKRKSVTFLDASIKEKKRRVVTPLIWFMITFLSFIAYGILGGRDWYVSYLLTIFTMMCVILLTSYVVMLEMQRYIDRRLDEEKQR